MPVIGDASVLVDADTRPFEKNLTDGATKSATGAGSIIKGILGAAVIQQGAQMAVGFLKDSVAAARESNAIAAQTTAAIKSTGGAANVTAGEIDKLANSIARKTGIDDEEISKAENLLLTFTNVRNEAGKGNDIFNQSTKILADMGKALGTDTSGAAIQLGKALNDPVKGISALTRVGVTFNEEQKKTIENLVKTGDTAGAQKIILAELGKEFGGSAEAQATASDKLKVALGNLQEDIGNKLIPVIDKVATFLADNLPGAIDTAGKFFGDLEHKIKTMVETGKTVVGFVEDNKKAFEVIAGVIAAVVIPHFVAVGVAATVSAAQQAAAWVVTQAAAIAAVVVHSVQIGIMIAQWVASAAVAMANAVIIAAAWIISLGPIALVVAAVVGLAIVFAKNWDTIKDVVMKGVAFVVDKFLGLVGALLHGAASAFGWVPGVGPKLREAAKEFDGFRDSVNRSLSGIHDKIVQVHIAQKDSGDYMKAGAHAAGGTFAGWSWVGEKGPELMYAPQSVSVFSNTDSMAMLRAALSSDASGPSTAVPPAAAPEHSQIFRDLIIQGATYEGANQNAVTVLRELRGEAFRQGK